MAQNSWSLLGIGLFLGLTLGVGGLTLMKQVQPAPIIIQPAPTQAPPEPTATPGPIRVHVNGQVTHPDVYSLPPGSIGQDAIAAAGGFTAVANTAVINLAQPLQDGWQIYVPAEGEEAPSPLLMSQQQLAGQGDGGQSGGLVNINSAGLSELDALPGIGPSTAQNIISHREANGPFATIESLMDVTGIGPAKFETIREAITVGP